MTNHAAPALLPSLHALVEKWRNDYERDQRTISPAQLCSAKRAKSDADELEALLSRAATTQAGDAEELELSDQICKMQSDLLQRTAIVLKGAEKPLQMHGVDDLPEIAERAMDALRSANDLCRSAHQIAEREGKATRWTAFRARLLESCLKQALAIHGHEVRADSAVATAKTFRIVDRDELTAPPSQPVAPVVADGLLPILPFHVLEICTAYESGFGQPHRKLRNPYREGSDAWHAYAHGKEIAEERIAQPQEREPRETTVPIVEGRRCPADGELCVLRECTFNCQCRTAINPAEKRRELARK